MDAIYSWNQVHSQNSSEKKSYFETGVKLYSEVVKEMEDIKETVDTKRMEDTHQTPNGTYPTKHELPNGQYLKKVDEISQEVQETDDTKEIVDTKKMADTHQTPNGTDPIKHELPKSQFFRKVDEISVFHNVWIALLARYSLIKEKHPIIKVTMEFGENTAYWIQQKVEYVVTTTKMDGKLKKLDSAALSGVVKLEDTHNNVRNRFLNANMIARSRIEDATEKVNRGREWVRSWIFIPAHTVFDFVEKKFEAVMLKKSSEKSELSNEPGFANTVSRLIDVTYRFNLGVVSVAGQKAKEVTERVTEVKKNCGNFYVARIQPHTPNRVRVRQSIIFQEILKELKSDAGSGDGNSAVSYKENKELLELDRNVINIGRGLIFKAKDIKQDISRLPSKAWDAGATTLSWTKKTLERMSEAKTIRNLAGLGLYEVRIVLLEGQGRFDVLRNSTLLNRTISWMASQQKSLSSTITINIH